MKMFIKDQRLVDNSILEHLYKMHSERTAGLAISLMELVIAIGIPLSILLGLTIALACLVCFKPASVGAV